MRVFPFFNLLCGVFFFLCEHGEGAFYSPTNFSALCSTVIRENIELATGSYVVPNPCLLTFDGSAGTMVSFGPENPATSVTFQADTSADLFTIMGENFQMQSATLVGGTSAVGYLLSRSCGLWEQSPMLYSSISLYHPGYVSGALMRRILIPFNAIVASI